MRNDLGAVRSKLSVDLFEYATIIDVSTFEEPTYTMFEILVLCDGEYILITVDDRDRVNGYASIDFHIPTSKDVLESECYALIDDVLGDDDANYPLDEIKEFSNLAGDVYDNVNRYFVDIGCSEIKDAINSVSYANTDLFNREKRVVLREDVLKTIDLRSVVSRIKSSRDEVDVLFSRTVMFQLLGL